MKYLGSKARIAKYILPIILKDRTPNQFYIEPFVGGANLICKVKGNRFGSDNNKYLIAMWQELQKGWTPPSFITREFYSECREKYNKDSANLNEYHIIGYVGFNGSYGGRFYDGGYAGISKTKDGKERNYPLEAYNNVIGQVDSIKGIIFNYCDYSELIIPNKSIIYCDIPYKGAKKYKTALDFDYDNFWNWCRDKHNQGHTVYVSEYEAPSDFICVWEKKVSSSLRVNSVIKGSKKSVERLFTLSPKTELGGLFA